MTRADSVLSTPQTLVPTTAHVSAPCGLHPCVPSPTRYRKPESQPLTSESRKAAEGPSRRPTKWTKEELELARRLLKERKPDSEFRKLLGRLKAHAQESSSTPPSF
jgi:hypothetical protein